VPTSEAIQNTGAVGFTGTAIGSGFAFHFYLLATTTSLTVGNAVYAYSTFLWTGADAPTISNYFVVGRDASYNNKDFGYTGSWIPSPRAHIEFNDVDNAGRPQFGGGAMIYFASRTVDSKGTWQFWTCFYLNQIFYNFADTISVTVS